MAIRYPTMGPGQSRINETRKCEGCGLTVMAKGDWNGWKGVDAGGSLGLKWYCDKLPCRQLRDEFVTRRSQEMVLAQQKEQGESEKDRELKQLRARVAELETTVAKSSSLPPPAPEVFETDSAPALVHLANSKNNVALCGSVALPRVKAEDMTWELNPCAACAEKWQAINAGTAKEPNGPETSDVVVPGAGNVMLVPSSDGKKNYRVTIAGGAWSCECDGFKHRRTCRHIAVGQARFKDAQNGTIDMTDADAEAAAAPAVPAVPSAAAALYGEQKPLPPPAAPAIDQLPRFSPAFIEHAAQRPDEHVGQVILIVPEAYPEMDFAKINPESMRKGVTALFKKSTLVVDQIEHACEEDGTVLGIVFTLKRP